MMATLHIHIIALQDIGYVFKSQESKQLYGDYKIQFFKFGDSQAETLAFIINEGLSLHIIKANQVIEDTPSRSMMIEIPGICQGESLYLLNTYAPAKQSQKGAYIKELQKHILKYKLSPRNTVIMGDLNDYISSQLDRWSSKGPSSSTKGAILNPLKKIKFYDIFRTIHPEFRAFSRVGFY